MAEISALRQSLAEAQLPQNQMASARTYRYQMECKDVEILKLRAALRELAEAQAKERDVIATVLRIACDQQPGAAANSVREDYPELTDIVDAAFAGLRQELAEARRPSAKFCRDCRTVESAGGDDNVRLCKAHADPEAKLADKDMELAKSQKRIDFDAKIIDEKEAMIHEQRSALASTREELAAEKDRFERHTIHVGGFLRDMYSTMIDPLADGELKVKETCEELLKAATDQRQREHDLEAKLTAARENEDAAITEAKRQCSAKLLMTEKAEGLAQQLAASESQRKALEGQVERLTKTLTEILDTSSVQSVTEHYSKMMRLAQSALSETAAGKEEDGIYVASRASIPERSAMWRDLRDNHGWKITSSWIDEAGEGETGNFGELWTRIYSEIARSSKLVLYARQEDFPLKGALIEVGIALGMGKPVVVCLPFIELDGRTMRPVGSWLAHPNVKRIDSLHDAMNASPADSGKEG